MKKIKVGIIGGAGYTGGELVRLLLNHAQVEIAFVQSKSQTGQLISKTHRDLTGECSLRFTDDESLLQSPELKLLFLAQGHGEARKFLESAKLNPEIRIIDLSQDFRLKATAKFLGREFVYGLPELNRDQIKKSANIANPGCFATAIQLALLPLAKAAVSNNVSKLRIASVSGITGSTGAGQKLADTSHFSFRTNNIQAYKVLTHQHVAEIEESLAAKINFVPLRGDFARGIFVSAILERSQFSFPATKGETVKLYEQFYEGHPFVSVTTDAIDLKAVVNTNRAWIEIQQEGDSLVVNTVIDNLLKGASGQAVQNMNLIFGFPETEGLKLKGVAF